MTLEELEHACRPYAEGTPRDGAYSRLMESTDGNPDLSRPDHRMAILRWLNAWGCRHLARAYHDLASESLSSWYTECQGMLPERHESLLALHDRDLEGAATAFASLVRRTAARGGSGAVAWDIHIGPTAASKIFFVLRPHAFPPWDASTRKEPERGDWKAAYLKYLVEAKSSLGELDDDCRRHDLEVTDLPHRLGRPDCSIPKLLDEYLMVRARRR